MGKVLPEDDDVLDLPGGTELDGEGVGTADDADLVLAEIADGPEDIGLDTETAPEVVETSLDGEPDEGGSVWSLDEAPVEIDNELDIDGEEHGWTQESEGSTDGWDDDLPTDEETGGLDDGGLEGVDDSLLDDLDADDDESALLEEEEDDLDSPEDLGEDLVREISPLSSRPTTP